MYEEGEEIFYYLTLYNENYPMPPMPEGVERGHSQRALQIQGRAPRKRSTKAHISGSGPIIREALRAQDILGEQYGVSADVWSATSYKLLRNDALRPALEHAASRPSRRENPISKRCWKTRPGSFVAVSDNMKIVPDQIAPWVPGGLMTLGTDGFGRSDTRENLRRFFEVDAEITVIATLYALAEKGQVETKHGRAGDQGTGRGPGEGACSAALARRLRANCRRRRRDDSESIWT